MSGFVYAIECGDAVKVGFAKSPRQRVAYLQVGSPEPMRLMGYIRGTPADEARAHAWLRESRVRGEWFRNDPELTAWIAENCDQYDPRVHGGGQVISDRLAEASTLVRKAALPVLPGDTIAKQILRAHERIGFMSHRKVKSLWYFDTPSRSASKTLIGCARWSVLSRLLRFPRRLMLRSRSQNSPTWRRNSSNSKRK